MPYLINLTGHRFGRLIALSYEGDAQWLCRCDCGNVKAIAAQSLRRGWTQSCGCWRRERLYAAHYKHGMTGTRVHKLWGGMRRRCNDPRYTVFANYGGRGVQVCERWDGPDGFTRFLADMGEPPRGMTIDRIDPDGDFEPSNCRWVIPQEQFANKRGRPSPKLKDDDVVAIRADLRPSPAIAADYGVTASTVWRVKSRRAWAHLP